MKQEEVDKTLRAIKNASERVLKSRSESLKFLISAGILPPETKLKPKVKLNRSMK